MRQKLIDFMANRYRMKIHPAGGVSVKLLLLEVIYLAITRQIYYVPRVISYRIKSAYLARTIDRNCSNIWLHMYHLLGQVGVRWHSALELPYGLMSDHPSTRSVVIDIVQRQRSSTKVSTQYPYVSVFPCGHRIEWLVPPFAGVNTQACPVGICTRLRYQAKIAEGRTSISAIETIIKQTDNTYVLLQDLREGGGV